jgi:hypothetical protein
MSSFVTTAFVQQYKANVQLKLQQMGSRLRSAVTVDTYMGKGAKAVEQVGPVEAVVRSTRHGDTPLIHTPHDARWVHPKDYEWADLVDDQDKLRMLIDPQSPYARNAAVALGRSIDRAIITAMDSDTAAKTGEDGDVNTAFEAGGGTIVAAGGSGMSVAKLRAAKLALMNADVDVDNEDLFIAIKGKEHDELLQDTLAVNLDYTNKPVLVEGRIFQFMGFNFIHTQLLGDDPDAAGTTRCPCWARSGVHLGMWNDINVKISERADKSYSTQVYAKATFGATRIEEGKCVEIECA